MTQRSADKPLQWSKGKYRVIFKYAGEWLVGFLFSHIVLGGGLAPFGIAYCANCGIIGVIGSVVGYAVRGYDVYRYMIACVVAFAAHQFLGRVLRLPFGISGLLYCIWGILMAGIGGIFIYEYSLSENFFFIVSGLLGGVFSYAFGITAQVIKKKSRAPVKIRYICFIATISVLTIGVMSLGKIATGVASVLIVFFLCCMVKQCGFLYACTTAMILSFGIYWYDKNMGYLVGILVLGAVLAGILKDLGKYAVVLGFVASNILVNIYLRGSFDVWMMLVYVCAGGVLYLFMPQTVMSRLFRIIAPFDKKKEVLVLKRKVAAGNIVRAQTQKMKNAEAFSVVEPICGKCRKRFICWLKNKKQTSEMLLRMGEDVRRPDFIVPAHFSETCLMPDQVIGRLRGKNAKRMMGYEVNFVKASRSRDGEIRCGDTSGTFLSADGRYVLSIADGMGSGNKAAQESEHISALMKTLMSRGLDRRDVLLLINDALRRIDSETTLGLDVAIIDLMSGRCEWMKADAAPSFVLRNGNVFELGDASLPVGILDDLELPVRSCTLLDSDILIMVSDGFMNHGTKWLRECIFRLYCAQKDELGMAVGLLDAAAKRKLSQNDDISVIVATIRSVIQTDSATEKEVV